MSCTSLAPPAGATRQASPSASLREAARAAWRIAAAAAAWPTARPVVLSDPHLEVLVARGDDRLLADAGLRRVDVMDRWRFFRERELEPMLRSSRR